MKAVEGIIINCSCPKCGQKFTSYSSGVILPTDTFESVAEEMCSNIRAAHKECSPLCDATEDEILVTSSKRVSN